MKVQPYKPHIIHQNTNINTRINNLSLMIQMQNLGWVFHVPPNHKMVKPNLFQPFTPVPYSNHECGTHKTHQKKHQTSMDSTRVLHLHCEEFECLLVSQGLL